MKSPRCWPVLCSRTLLFVLLSVTLARSAAAQYCWVGGGSIATVDDEDLAIAEQGAELRIRSTAPLPAVVDARDNVVGIWDFVLEPTPVNRLMTVRYLDNGTEARVQVFLRQQSLSTGASTDLLTFDSDAYPASNTVQVREIPIPLTCSLSNALATTENLYFVRLQLTKSGAGGTPAVHMVRVCLVPC